jgi:hypothetical protein
MACSLWCLQTPTESTRHQDIFVHIRDRAAILLSSQTAFRGDSARSLLWSDLFLSKVKLHDVLADDGYILVGLPPFYLGPFFHSNWTMQLC